MTEKVEFGSAEWIDVIRNYFEDRVAAAGDKIVGQEARHCQIFTDPPEHLTEPGKTYDGKTYVAWWFHIKGPTVQVGTGIPEWWPGPADDDYNDILPFTKVVFAENPEAPKIARERIARHRAEAEARGQELPPGPMDFHPDILAMLRDLHDYLAPRIN